MTTPSTSSYFPSVWRTAHARNSSTVKRFGSAMFMAWTIAQGRRSRESEGPAGLGLSDPQLLLQQLVHRLRVGLAGGRFHDLADEPAERRGLGLHLLDLVGIGGDHGVDGGLDGAGVGDLTQAPLLDDVGGIAALAPDDLEQVLGDLAGDRIVDRQLDYGAQLFWRYRRAGYLFAFLVQTAKQIIDYRVGHALGYNFERCAPCSRFDKRNHV